MRISAPVVQRIGQLQHALASLAALPVGSAFMAIALACCAVFLQSVPLHTRLVFSMGGADPLIARHFYAGETTDDGRGFRWTDGDGALLLPAQGLGAHTLQLTIAAPRPAAAAVPLKITMNDRPVLTLAQPPSPRRYHLLVPAAWMRLPDNVIRLQSDTFRPQQDTAGRMLGVVVFDVAWQAPTGPRWLVPIQIIVVGVSGLLFLLVLAAARVRPWMQLLLLALFLAGMLAMRHSDSRFVYRWNAIVMTLTLSGVLAALLVVLRSSRPAADATRPFREWARMHWQAGAAYAGVTAIMLSPLLMHFTTHIVGAPGDNFEYLWKMQWFSDALLKQQVSPVFAPQIFYPSGAELTISEMTPAHTLLGVPLTWLFGATVSYNLAITGSFVLTAFCTYLLAHRIGAPRGAAWVAGLIFAFCLRRFFHANGHFGMLGTQWPVLALYGWEGALTRRRAWDAHVTGLGLALTVWASWHYGTTFPLLLAVYTVLRPGVRQLPALLRDWRLIAIVAAIVIPLTLPMAQPYVEARQRGETYQHLYAQVLRLSAAPGDYLLPNPFHPLWGTWAGQFYTPDRGEQYVAPGYSVLALALAGLWIGRRQPIVQALLAVLLINLVLSFGPELRLSETASVSLPARLVYEHVPVLGNIRNWSRMSIYVALCAALLAGLALTRVPWRWRRLAVPAAAALVLLESASVLPLSSAGPRPVDLWLRQQPGTGAVAQVPNGFGGPSEYYTLFTGKPTNQGVGKFPPALYREGRDILFGFPRAPALRLAQRWQTAYIIVDEGAMQQLMPKWREMLARQPLATEVYRSGGYSVYRVKGP